MYLDFFNFKEPPFGVTPDPRFIYLGRTHEQALSSLSYGIEQRQGFIMVTGEVGTGKTLLCRTLLRRLGPETHTALVLNPNLDPPDLLRVIAADFGCANGDGTTAPLDALSGFLLSEIRKGKNAALLIDEAQTLPDKSLEAIRLLSNLETDREKLLQIVLVGQPELLAKLKKPQLRQVNQRITVRFRLQPLDPGEIRRYVAHRLKVAAGAERPELFSGSGLRAVSRLSRGFPREINALCDRALLAAYAAGRKRVGLRLVYRAHRDLRREPARRAPLLPQLLRWGLLSILLAGAAWIALEPGRFAGRSPGPSAAVSVPAAPSTVAPAAALPAAEPAPAQTPPTAEPDRASFSDSVSLSASLTALAQRWKLERLAAEVRQWQFVSLQDRSLPAFFQKSGLARAHGVEIISRPAALPALRSLDLPCLASEKTAEGYRFVLLAGLQEKTAVVLDHVDGRRVLPAEEWLSRVRGALYFLVPSGALAEPLRSGDRGPPVLALQKTLRRAGLLRSGPGGVFGPETRAAVLALQRKYGLTEDGIAGFETQLNLLRLGGRAVPSLREAL